MQGLHFFRLGLVNDLYLRLAGNGVETEQRAQTFDEIQKFFPDRGFERTILYTLFLLIIFMLSGIIYTRASNVILIKAKLKEGNKPRISALVNVDVTFSHKTIFIRFPEPLSGGSEEFQVVVYDELYNIVYFEWVDSSSGQISIDVDDLSEYIIEIFPL